MGAKQLNLLPLTNYFFNFGYLTYQPFIRKILACLYIIFCCVRPLLQVVVKASNDTKYELKDSEYELAQLARDILAQAQATNLSRREFLLPLYISLSTYSLSIHQSCREF
jgi:hypothetical protein